MLRRGLCRAVSTARCTRRTDYAGNCARITECPILGRYRWPAMLQEAILARSRESSSQSAANYLALSGGSDNGAFGAGVLGGWTILGTRPTFKLLTGVSTGALIAPFAFLGPAYDPELRAVYTEISPEDVFERRGLYRLYSTTR
jgi:Patatin-like phospholipase